jgi:(1->4)-alpha-D-glucan 1-alpha-D-glucosylmutase
MLIEPRATYRIQLSRDFGFEEAADLVPYLADLGISHLYCSPIMQAVPGSTHGYDVVDRTKINQELGGASAYEYLCNVLHEHDMNHILDVVPNHMAITGAENPWWWDVLENGPSSRYAAYFDVDWDPPQSLFSNLVLLPVLGNHYGRILEAGELKLKHQQGIFILHYYEHVFPVAPRSLSSLLEDAAQRCGSEKLAFISDALANLPLATATDLESVQLRHRDKEVLLGLLTRLCQEQPAVSKAIDEVVSDINSQPDELDALTGQQNYRLAFWHMAEQDLGYRRFFDINSLVGLRIEEWQVFEDTHRLIFKLVQDGMTTGLRIDHPDGLRNPGMYFQRLKQSCPNAWIVAEKILESNEKLRDTWDVNGTTGYDFLNRLNGLFVDPNSERALSKFYSEFTGERLDYNILVYEKKRQIIHEVLGSDVNRLTGLLLSICERHRRHRDYSRYQLQQAVQEIAACFPVYRTYIQADTGQITEEDEYYIEQAVDKAKTHNPDMISELFDYIRDLLLLRIRGEVENEFVMHFQQFTAPVMAKGVEDTAFYCFNRLISLNEVGGDPSRFGVSAKTFHKHCKETQENWPHTMLATSTHDTKRSEDVRARLNLLSEMPVSWTKAVRRWSDMNAPFRKQELPDRNTEYLLYQTLVGAWPIGVERTTSYMEKAVREAKVYTSWTNPDSDYEEALKTFITNIFKNETFVADLESFVSLLIEPGRINSMAQTLIKLTAPGIPDLYQGTELWDLSLVDPDNRRPRDYNSRIRLLAELQKATPEIIMTRIDEALPKLWIIHKTLALRKRQPELFGPQADYQPLIAEGSNSDHVLAFMRSTDIITVIPRLILGLREDWDDTILALPRRRWCNEFTQDILDGGAVSVAELLSRFPVCLLSKKEGL